MVQTFDEDKKHDFELFGQSLHAKTYKRLGSSLKINSPKSANNLMKAMVPHTTTAGI